MSKLQSTDKECRRAKLSLRTTVDETGLQVLANMLVGPELEERVKQEVERHIGLDENQIQ